MTGTDITLITAAIGSTLAFLGTVANMVNINYKELVARQERLDMEERNRRWAKEDKEELARRTAEDLRRTQSVIGHHFEALQNKGNERLKAIVAGQEEIKAKVDENTELSAEAFKEANGVNAKLVALGRAPIEPAEVVVVNQAPIPVKQTK